ncbi:hypothetical protein BU23DRAFT_308178 [Bimuria novae-zelandiae CBS 107.79]|uniref:Uncharacterized protein n=1 Tax=Bimuria novae-zelandiae CBS 107.79 TaxID=1447943 RepID=A0A6A5UP19_9PLEO|nr:hypothetical protein BU23DRAFT_308178 [Bimuria novae-zelandiae CBS 107.79]
MDGTMGSGDPFLHYYGLHYPGRDHDGNLAYEIYAAPEGRGAEAEQAHHYSTDNANGLPAYETYAAPGSRGAEAEQAHHYSTDNSNALKSEDKNVDIEVGEQRTRPLLPSPIKGQASGWRLGLNPKAKEFTMSNASSSPKNISSGAPSTDTQPSTTKGTPPKEPVRYLLPEASGFPSLGHITWDPNTDMNELPHREFTHETPECAAIGKYLTRPKLPKPDHPYMNSSMFTMVIRFEGPFDRNGRQPGLFIPQTKNFTIRVLTQGYAPGERKVEIWRNGETFQLFGLVGLWADDCAWVLGDKELRRIENGNYKGWKDEMRSRDPGPATGQP